MCVENLFLFLPSTFYYFIILDMPSHRKKSPTTECKRKTRASDKARTSPRKNKKAKTESLNDGSYLQMPDQQQPSVSTVSSTAHLPILATTGQHA